MKKLFFITTFIFVFGLVLPPLSLAQEMMDGNTINSDGHTAREEAEGKVVWEKLQAKQVACADLSTDDFGVLGEYFMGQVMGDSHEAMNNMMIQTHGAAGEEQIHVLMGQRLFGCDASAPFPAQGVGFMPMMNMMWGGRTMNFGFGPFGGFSGIFMILWWVLIIVGIVVLTKWLIAQSRGSPNHEKSPLEILKERYAKGEIDKKEFEERKKEVL